MRPRYFGPVVVVSRNKGGAYIVCDMDGTLAHTPIAAFRLLPYVVREVLIIPDLEQYFDVSTTRLREMERGNLSDPDDPDNGNSTLGDECEQPETEGDSEDRETEASSWEDAP